MTKKSIIKNFIAFILTFAIFVVSAYLICNDNLGQISRDLTGTTDDGWEYIKLYDDSKKHTFVVLTGYDGNEHEELIIPSSIDGTSVETIDSRIFRTGYELKKLVIPWTVETIGWYAFEFTDIDNIVFEEGSRLRRLEGRRCLSSMTLESIELPETVDYIGEETFSSAFQLKRVYIGKNVREIGDGAFFDTIISDITVSEYNDRYEVKDGLLIDMEKNRLISYDHELYEEKITIPSYIHDVDAQSIDGRWLKNIEVEKTNECFASYEGCLYSKDYKSFLRAPTGRIEEDFSFHDGVETIEEYAFWYCSGYDRVNIPDTVQSIEIHAFSDQDVYLPKTVKCVDMQTFYGTLHFEGTSEEYKKIGVINAIPEDTLMYDLIIMED